MMLSPLKPLKLVLNRISARSRIALGQVMLLVGVMFLAVTIGIVPNEQKAVVAGRSKLCEAIAVHCSIYVGRGEIENLAATFPPLVERDKDITSAVIRKDDGEVICEVGEPIEHTSGKVATSGQQSDVVVPIFSGEERWGTVEIRFKPLTKSGFWSRLATPQMQLVAFVAATCTGLFLVYLRKVLQHLDPSKVVPPRVRTALDTLAEGLLVVDNTGSVMLANQAFANITGGTPEKLMGSKVADLPWLSDPSAPDQPHPWLQVMGDGKPQRGAMMRLVDQSGSVRTFSVNCSPILGDAGKHRGVLVSLDDITELRNKEEELRKSRDIAEQASRAKSDFLAHMSHEIRTPMNAILGFADVLRRGYERDATERQEHLQTIHSSGQHLLELINDVLDLSKIEAGKLEIELGRCSPHKLIREVVSVLSVRAEQKGIGLEFKWDGLAPDSMETDATRLRQVITNLIGNAIKFTDTGAVRLAARLVNQDTSPSLEIRIADTGIGMKPESLAKLFQPFTQADSSITRRFGGTGLGLTISKQIAEALGGGIHVASEYGKGSVFTITVNAGPMSAIRMVNPASIAAAEEAAASAPQQELKLPPCRVLLVEDGVSNRKLITLVLSRAGATLEEAEDGKAGSDLALAGEHDVVLMDMQMPIMDGYTAATLLRSRGYKKPIIALTAHAMRGDEEKCKAAGCSGFLTKPIDMDLLVRTVAGAIGTEVKTELRAVSRPAAERPAGAPASAKPAKAGGSAPLRSSLPTEDADFAQIVVEFVDRLQEQLGHIRRACDQGELAEVAQLAHWVKGSGGTAGFAELTAPARELEFAAKEKRLDDVKTSIANLQALADRIELPNGGGSGATPTEPASAVFTASAPSPLSVHPAGDAPLRSSLPTEDADFAQIVVEFVDRLHEQLGHIKTACDQGELAEIAQLAHWVKGSGGTAGFDALTLPARELEYAARDQRLDDVRNAISTLQDLVDRIEAPEPTAPAEKS